MNPMRRKSRKKGVGGKVKVVRELMMTNAVAVNAVAVKR
jgi:hypothetical protein